MINFLLATSISFFVYVFLNFKTFIQQGKAVYQVAYEPKIFLYDKLRLFTVFIVVIFLFRDQFSQYYQWNASREIVTADAYAVNNEEKIAQEYYRKSFIHSPLNHKANYSLGRMAEKELKISDQKSFLKKVLFATSVNK